MNIINSFNKKELVKPFYEKELERIKNDWEETHPERVERFTNQYLVDGFSDEDTWGLDVHLTKLILPRLKRYKELAKEAIVIDFPLDDMIEAFEIYKEVDYDPWKLRDEKQEKFQKGMKAFSEYFLALWW